MAKNIPAGILSGRSLLIWRIVQSLVWLVGVAILFCLLFVPSVGITLFWNILIPVAPALLVLAPGVWRNICPLATTNLLPRHLGLSKEKKLTASQSGKLSLLSVVLLYTLVPLRHALFNSNGPATALLIIAMSITGMILGFFYEWKSAWCSGLCPVHPVEKLYGGNAAVRVPNAHCVQCQNCVVPCPDSTPNIYPGASKKNLSQILSGLLIVGGLPGFIWGWFYVPDDNAVTSLNAFLQVYKMPLIGFTISFAAYVLLSEMVTAEMKRKLISLFAAAGVSCYYWYRLPSLFGFGRFAKDGLLIDLSHVFPAWIFTIGTTATTIFFIYWLVFRKENKKSWVIRPEYATTATL